MKNSVVSGLSAIDQIRVLVTHPGMHQDEAWGITNIRKDTTGRFPGAAHASVVVFKNEAELEMYSNRSDTLFFGCGAKYREKCPGRVFDEHGEKDKGKCCADLVTEVLGNQSGPLSVMHREVRLSDLQKRTAPMSLATVMKIRYEQDKEANVISWALQGLSALYDHLMSGEPLVILDNEFVDITSQAYMLAGQSMKADPKWFAALLNDLHAASLGRNVRDIGTIFYALAKKDLSDARRWLQKAARDIAVDQISFHQALKEFLKSKSEIEIEVDFNALQGDGMSPGPLRVAFIESDNRHMHKVYRRDNAGGCEILVQQNSKGQVQIFTDEKARLNLDTLARMVRFAEISASHRAPHSWWGLGKPDTLECVSEWFYFKEGGMLLNGSNAHPNIAPTRLTYLDFVEIFKHAFTWKGLQSFMLRHKVNDSRVPEKKSHQPQPRRQEMSRKINPDFDPTAVIDLGAELDRANQVEVQTQAPVTEATVVCTTAADPKPAPTAETPAA